MDSNAELEQLLDKSQGSIYKLVILASRRALEIAAGQPQLAGANSHSKPTTIALREIAAGKVQCRKAKSESN